MDKLEYNVAEFASRWKQAFSPDSVARGKATAQTMAINAKSIAQGNYPMSQGYKDLEQGISKGQQLSSKGRQAMAAKAASSNRTMKPTTQRGLLKAAPARGQLSSKSANSFKQGAQNQATNKENLFKAKREDSINKLTGQGKYKPEYTTPTLNPFEQSSWEKNATKGVKMQPMDVSGKLKTLSPVEKPGFLKRVGGAIRRNPVAAGAGIGAVGGAIGYGLYKKMKSNNNRQNKAII